jgi:hypothetical protein
VSRYKYSSTSVGSVSSLVFSEAVQVVSKSEVGTLAFSRSVGKYSSRCLVQFVFGRWIFSETVEKTQYYLCSVPLGPFEFLVKEILAFQQNAVIQF